MDRNSVFAWWIANPIAANLAMIILIVAGVMSYNFGVEKEPFPSVEFPAVNISVRWNGASPQDMEEQILVRIEEAVKNIEGVKEIHSNAWTGNARVHVRGKERVDKQKFFEAVRENVSAINGLPNDADRINVSAASNRQPMIRIALYGSADPVVMTQLGREMRSEIGRLPLISSVDLRGEHDEDIVIEVAEATLRRFNLTFDEISSAIRGSSVNGSSGVVRGDSGAVQLSVRSRAEDVAAFEDIILRRSDDGAVLRVGDVAQIVNDPRDRRRVSIFDGENALRLDVLNSDYMDIPRMSASVREYIEAKQKELPDNIKLSIWGDWNEPYQGRLSMLFKNAMSGLVLVILLLMFFLQPNVALWVAAGIATAFAAAFTLMPVLDVSLTMLSLFAFLMVIGIVVDDAIVVGESIHRANERGYHDEEAALIGVKEVAKPVMFGVITTMVVFAPMAFLPGTTSEFTRSISIVVCLALAFSLFEAFCILPAHLRHLEHPEDKGNSNNRLLKAQLAVSKAFESTVNKYYSPAVSWCLRHRFSVVLTFIGFFVLSVSLVNLGYVKKKFFPEIQSDEIKVVVTMPEMTSQDRSFQVMEQVNAGVQRLTAIVHDMSAESNNPNLGLIKHFYTQKRGTEIRVSIRLVEEENLAMPSPEVADRLRELIGEIPDAEEIDFSSTLNTQEARIGFTISSSSSEALAAASADLKNHLMTYDGVFLVRDNIGRGGVEMVFSLKPGAESLGVNIQNVSKQVRQAYIGQEVQRLPKAGGDSRIYVKYTREERESLETLEGVRIRTGDGREIPLMSVVDVSMKPSVQSIRRRNGSKVANIRAEYAGDAAWSVRNKINKEFVPEWSKRHPEVKWGQGGRGRDQNEFMNTVLLYEGMALLVAYVLMAVAFKSYVQPFLLMSAIPFAYMGALYGHLIHGVPYGMFSMLGFLAAAGVVINDNLLLVDFINRLRSQGHDTWSAAKEAGRLRFRPIILTSLTTFVGLLPMLSAQSVQAQFLIPMVVSLAYGVLVATVVTLVFVPCLYVLSANIGARVRALYS